MAINDFGRVLCPHCGNRFDLLDALNHADARRFIELLTQLPPDVIRPYYSYLKLFKPAKQALRWSKVLKLTEELAPMIKDATIKRNGILYRVPTQQWAQVLTDLAEQPPKTLTLPLDGHGYLLSILANQAEQHAAKTEYKQEQQRQQRVKPGAATGLQPVTELIKQRSKPPEGWKGGIDKKSK